MIKKICLTTFIFLIIAMPAYSFAADDELDWGLLDKESIKKEDMNKFAQKGDVIIPQLHEAFKDDNANKKKNVIHILKQIPGEKSKKEMVGILKTLCTQPLSGRRWKNYPEEERLKQETLGAFSSTGGEGLSVLKNSLKGAKGEFRKCLIIGTGFMEDSTYYASIVEILNTDENPYLRRYSALALGMIGDEKAIPVLENALMNDSFSYYLDNPESRDYIVFEDGMYYPVREGAAFALLGINGRIYYRNNK